MSLLYSANSVLGYDLMADSDPAVAKHACLLKEAINHKHCVKSSFLAYKLHLMWITLWSYYFIYTTPSSVLKFWMPVTYSKHVCGVPSTLQCEADRHHNLRQATHYVWLTFFFLWEKRLSDLNQIRADLLFTQDIKVQKKLTFYLRTCDKFILLRDHLVSN